MLEFFTNPGYLAAAGALVSAPIIIHLINRMRFKRVRWAAMEFLLKAQKRMRKRLIIEQLLLLMLRCLLVALVGLLVMRFVGFSIAGIGSKQGLHVVLLDDTLSMKDGWRDGEKSKDGFTVALNEVLLDKIVNGIAKSGNPDKLVVIPLSQVGLDRNFNPKFYEKLNDERSQEELAADLFNYYKADLADAFDAKGYRNKKELQVDGSDLHVPILAGVKKAQEIVNNNPNNRITIHILSDFRQREWTLPDAEP